MKNLLPFFCIVLAFSMSPAMSKDWKEIRIGVEGAYPPFNQLDKNGEPVGFDVDIDKALCEEMQVQCSFVVQDWDGMVPALMARKFDAVVSSMAITEERKKKIAFTGKYYNAPAQFVVKKGTTWDFSAEGLKDKRIGVESTTMFDRYVSEMYEKQGVKVLRYAKQEDAFLDLTAGRVDLVLANVFLTKESFFKSPLGAGFELQGPELTDVKYFGEGSGIATR